MANVDCPDNSTTCLLRALLSDNTSQLILEQLIEANNAYDWNPVTLGFTVAIGVLAFIVAVVTVFQGCLAAGPGRLKSGHQAIGPWYVYSDAKFSWYQLAVRSTAQTPFIDMKALTGEVATFGSDNRMKPVTRYQKFRNQILFGVEESQLGSDISPYNASWANLLLQACLTRTDEFGKLESCPTDYIEDSLRAAPASGMMKSLVFFTVYVNDSSVIQSPEDARARLYCVRGLSSDLISRDLETMGPAAAFVAFGSSESLAYYRAHSESLSLGRDDMIASFHLFNGKVRCGDAELDVLSFGDPELSVRGFKEHDKIFTTTRRKLRGSVSHFRTSNGFFKTNQCPMLLALCIADVIVRPRAFPKRTMYLIEAIAALTKSTLWRFALANRFWTSFVEFAHSVAGTPPSKQRRSWRFPARHREAPFLKMSTPSTPGLRNPTQWDAKVEIASIVYTLTRSIARRPRYNPEKLRKSESKSILETIHGDRSETDRHRILVQNEILCVDEWLRQRDKKDPNVTMCALMVLMKVVDTKNGLPTHEDEGVHHDQKKKNRNPSLSLPVNDLDTEDRKIAMNSAFVYVRDAKETYYSSAESQSDDETDTDDESKVADDLKSNAGTDRDSYRGKTKIDKTESDVDEMWKIVEVWRYRALLYAAMLDLCADSSAFGESYTDFAVKII